MRPQAEIATTGSTGRTASWLVDSPSGPIPLLTPVCAGQNLPLSICQQRATVQRTTQTVRKQDKGKA